MEGYENIGFELHEVYPEYRYDIHLILKLCFDGNYESLKKELKDKKLKINETYTTYWIYDRGQYFCTPLDMACKEYKNECVKLLLLDERINFEKCTNYIYKNDLVKEFKKDPQIFRIKYRDIPEGKIAWFIKYHKYYPKQFKEMIVQLLCYNRFNLGYCKIGNQNKKQKIVKISWYDLPVEILLYKIFPYFTVDYF